MPKLLGKSVNDKLVEYLGPITGRNYNTSGSAAPDTPEVTVVVVGTGAVQVQQTQTPLYRGNSGTNVFTEYRVPDETTWVNLGGPINAASGPTTVNPTVDSTYSAIRVIVTTAGEGRVTIQSDWE